MPGIRAGLQFPAATASLSHDHGHLIHAAVQAHYYLSHVLHSTGCLAFVFCNCSLLLLCSLVHVLFCLDLIVHVFVFPSLVFCIVCCFIEQLSVLVSGFTSRTWQLLIEDVTFNWQEQLYEVWEAAQMRVKY